MKKKLLNKEIFSLKTEGLVLDRHDLIERFNGNISLAQEMFNLFANSLEEELVVLLTAKEKKDWSTIKYITHKIRGGSAYCSAQRLLQASTLLEEYLATDNPNSKESNPLLERVIDEATKITSCKDFHFFDFDHTNKS